MKLSDFRIGGDFTCSGKRFRCTDIGSRVVVAIPLQASVGTSASDEVRALSEEQTAQEGWLDGPPYAVAEIVFDEDDLDLCSINEGDD